MLKKNVQLMPPNKKLSPWRKTALGMWRNDCDASIYSRLEIDATAIISKMQELKEAGHVISTGAILAKAMSESIKAFPAINSVIRFGRLYPRKEINIFFQCSGGKNFSEVSGVCIKKCDQLSIEEICQILRTESVKMRHLEHDNYRRMKLLTNLIPSFAMRIAVKIFTFISYTLNIKPYLFSEPDFFGSGMITSLSMFSIDNALVPLLPNFRCPLIIAVGKIQKKPIVDPDTDQIIVKPIIDIGVTMDHRLVDGYGGGKLLKTFKNYLTNLS